MPFHDTPGEIKSTNQWALMLGHIAGKNQKIMKKLTYLFILTFFITSCNKESETITDNRDLTGKWNWVITTGGINGDINETPSSNGKTYSINLNKDNSYALFENGIEVSTGTYAVSLKQSIHSQTMERFITYSDNLQEAYHVVLSGIIEIHENNRMTISDNSYDGIGSEFERME